MENSRRQIISWAWYDWANSTFATTVMAGFFPLFFKQYWCKGMADTRSTFLLGWTSSLAGFIVALAAPVLGAIADRAGRKKRMLAAFAFLGVAGTVCLVGVGKGHWELAALWYALASIGFAGGNIFYDSLLVVVAPANKRDFVSALGYALGYLGGGLLFAVNVIMTLHPAWFGLSGPGEAIKLSFLSVGIWWAVFTIPLLLWVKEPSEKHPITLSLAFSGFRQAADTLTHIRKRRPVLIFLVAYFLYIDGVGTVIRMAVDFGKAINLPNSTLIGALLITQFVGFPAAIYFGRLGERIGPRKSIYIGIMVYTLTCIGAVFMHSSWQFYALAIVVGLVQGGVQSLSRSYFSRLIPIERAGEFYGFYNMLGKYATVLGPALMGGLALLTGSNRVSILALIPLFLGGILLLGRIRQEDEHAPVADT